VRQGENDAMRNDELAGLERKYPFPPSEIKRMRARQWIMSYAMKRGVGAEIGVFRGHFSVHLIETLKPTKIYLIDPWTKTGEYFKFSAPYSNDGKLPTEVAFREARLRTNHFDDTAIQFIEGYFLEQIDQIKEKLDWVYLDASHRYEKVLDDLNGLRNVVKPQGVILGDDWYPNPARQHHGVFRAVQKFTRNSKFEIIAAGPGGQYCLKRAPNYQGTMGETPSASRNIR
jgi:hypothetical protein